ncbi:Transcription termination factor family protein [Hirschfeldia incana]|nr:Transcription termination factor family protein [Hirschfeldia incana]
MTLVRNPSRFTTLLKRLSQLSVENPFTPLSSATQKSRSFSTSQASSEKSSVRRTRNGIRVTPTIRKMAEEAMLDYFYSTRSLQYMVAESMSKNSPIFIENLLKKVNCVSASDINQSITKHLRFHPVNEFEPFLESSGLKPNEYTHLIPSGEIFLNELLLENHHVLCYCGVDPKKIGKVYEEARGVFGYETGVLASKIKAYEDFGFSRLFLSKLIACSPRILIGDTDMELVEVMEMLRTIGVDSDWVMKNISEEVSYDWGSVLRALTLLRGICNDEDELAGLIKNHPRLMFENSGKWTLVLSGFETKLGSSRRELYSLFLKLPQMQVEKCVSNLRRCFLFLQEIEMEDDEIRKVFRSHSWWIGSCTLKKTSSLLVNLKAYKTRVCNVVKENPEEMKKWTMGSKVDPLPATEVYLDSKAMKTQFLVDLGYEEGSVEMERAGKSFRGRGSELRERFEVLVGFGLDERDVKEMVRASPNILTQASDVLETKVKYLVEELGYPLSTLVAFPSCLKFTLERMKLRFEMFAWLKARGKADPKLAVSTLLACSDKDFARYFVSRHPDGPKHLEDLKRKQLL